MSAFDKAKLLEHCRRIQDNLDAIFVRGEDYSLAELPGGQAAWWAIEFVIRKLADEGYSGPVFTRVEVDDAK